MHTTKPHRCVDNIVVCYLGRILHLKILCILSSILAKLLVFNKYNSHCTQESMPDLLDLKKVYVFINKKENFNTKRKKKQIQESQAPLQLTSGTLGAGLRVTFSSTTFSLMSTLATLREPSRALGLNPSESPSGDRSSRV